MDITNDQWALPSPSDRNKVIYFVCQRVKTDDVEEQIIIDAYHYIAENKLARLTILDIKGIVDWAIKKLRKK